jgi:hypothetical protein
MAGSRRGSVTSIEPVFLLLSTSFPKPAIGTFGVEISGILMFIGSLFVLYYTYSLLQSARHQVLLATGSVLAIVLMIGAFVFTDRDRWVAPSSGIVKISVIVPTDGPYAILGNSFVKSRTDGQG